MVLKRLIQLTRSKSWKNRTAGSLGESLRPEDCFTLEIPQAGSDRATKDKIFLSPSMRGGNNSVESISSVSTITANSGSTKTLRSRSAIEYSKREKKNGKAVLSNKKSAVSSIAETISCGAFSGGGEPSSQQEESGFLCTVTNFLPCCAATVEPQEEAYILPDDRSDIVLWERTEEDTGDICRRKSRLRL